MRNYSGQLLHLVLFSAILPLNWLDELGHSLASFVSFDCFLLAIGSIEAARKHLHGCCFRAPFFLHCFDCCRISTTPTTVAITGSKQPLKRRIQTLISLSLKVPWKCPYLCYRRAWHRPRSRHHHRHRPHHSTHHHHYCLEAAFDCLVRRILAWSVACHDYHRHH